MFTDVSVDKYKVLPAGEVQLGGEGAADKAIFDGGKKAGLAEMGVLLEEIKELQKVLYAEHKQRILVVVQAMDTGGKDGCVKDVFASCDPQGIHIEPFKSPTTLELAHDFLWRVHAKVPKNGHIVVFNRSHYEDIIAVRVKKLMEDAVWQRRYQHVIDFEKMLAEEGTTIIKIFLNISKDEQKERLQARLDNPAKHWKFNPDDLADRARWGDFMHAYEDLIEKTSTELAPWYVVPADRKWYRNLVVARIVIERLKQLNMQYPKIDWKVEDVTID